MRESSDVYFRDGFGVLELQSNWSEGIKGEESVADLCIPEHDHSRFQRIFRRALQDHPSFIHANIVVELIFILPTSGMDLYHRANIATSNA